MRPAESRLPDSQRPEVLYRVPVRVRRAFPHAAAVRHEELREHYQEVPELRGGIRAVRSGERTFLISNSEGRTFRTMKE